MRVNKVKGRDRDHELTDMHITKHTHIQVGRQIEIESDINKMDMIIMTIHNYVHPACL